MPAAFGIAERLLAGRPHNKEVAFVLGGQKLRWDLNIDVDVSPPDGSVLHNKRPIDDGIAPPKPSVEGVSLEAYQPIASSRLDEMKGALTLIRQADFVTTFFRRACSVVVPPRA